MLFIAALPTQTFAASGIQPGQDVDFYFKSSSFTFKAGDYVGKCAQAGVDAPEGDVPARTRGQLSNDSIIAKLAYYYTYVEPWLEDSTSPTNIDPQWGNLEGFGRNYALTVAIQYANMGASAWRAAEEAYGAGFSDTSLDCFEHTAQYMINKVQNVNVPSGFEIYKMKAQDPLQEFMLWRMSPTGKIKLKKASANQGITG